MKLKNISIGIPVYNEEYNISNLLNDIKKQIIHLNLKSYEIIIISDSSKDNTNNILKSLKDKYIKIFYNKKRKGKAYCLNRILNYAKGNYLILFDADIRLTDNTILNLLKPLLSCNKVGLVSGLPIPFKRKGFFAQTSIISFYIQKYVKTHIKKGDNIYASHGRIMGLSKSFYKNLILPKGIFGTDAYIYLKNKKMGNKFIFVKDAITNYHVPNNKDDFLKQNIRFRQSKKIMENFFQEYIKEYNIPKIISFKIFFILILTHPISFFNWLVLYLYGNFKIKSIKTKTIWEISKSSKHA